MKTRKSIVETCRADDSAFCREVVEKGWLTEEQMKHAAGLYRLGKSRSGKTIFWMIDELGILRDGHVGDAWASQMLKAREPKFLADWHAEHCLFGLHLIGGEGGAEGLEPVAIVESERSAVVLSELYPKCLWMATVYPANLNERLLAPLQGHRVTLFPRTDLTGDTFLSWREIASQAWRRYRLDISVSTVLEDQATDEQKARGIDLLEYLIEN